MSRHLPHIVIGVRMGATWRAVYLRELSTTWRKADGGPGRRMLTEALFSRIEVLGGREATIHLTDEAVAYGFAAAIPDRLDVTVGYGRGERS
jgi:hypothetical protein